METKYFKKIYYKRDENGDILKDEEDAGIADKNACGIWNKGDAINYHQPADNKYTIEFITESEYNDILDNEIKEFNNRTIKFADLAATDKELPRSLEDLWDLLLLKGTIENTDIPANTKIKLDNKKALRAEYNDLIASA